VDKADLECLRDIADRLGLNLRCITRAYTEMSAASYGTRIEGNDLRDLFLGVVEQSAVKGLRSGDIMCVVRMLSRMMLRGKMPVDELRQQLNEHLPGTIRLLADAMGVDTQQLINEEPGLAVLGRFGRLMRADVADSIWKISESTCAALARLGNAVYELKMAIGEALPKLFRRIVL